MKTSVRLSLCGLALLLSAPPAAPAQDWRSFASSRLLRGEEAMEVHVAYSAGRFALRPGDGSVLYRLDSRYDSGHFDLRADYDRTDGRGRLRIDLEGERSINLGQLTEKGLGGGSLEIALTPGVPIDLAIELGAAEAELDLGGLALTGLDLRTGASDTRVDFGRPNPEVAERCTFRAGAASFKLSGLGNSGCRRLTVKGGVGALELDFSGEWGYDAHASVQVGLGSVEIRVPRDHAVRIENNTFLMAFSASGFQKSGSRAWVSEDWEGAERRLTIEVSGALGAINVTRR